MRRTYAMGVALLVLSGCGGDEPETFDEAAVIEALRPNWPGLDDAELADKAATFRQICELPDEDFAVQVALGGAGAEILAVGCPDRYAAAADG